MVLVNGATGIGSGYSTNIPLYNIKDIINWYSNKLQGKQNRKKIEPYYEGFKGEIKLSENGTKYISKGIFSKDTKGNIRITELPIGFWTQKFVDLLDDLIESKKIKDYINNSTDDEIDSVIIVNNDFDINELKLTTDIRLTNMMLFDKDYKLKKFNNVDEILEYFYNVRYDFYIKRKEDLISKIERKKLIIQNKGNFIQYILQGKLNINKKKKEIIEKELYKLKLSKIDDSYDYLLNMSFLSLSKERLDKLKEEFTNIKLELKRIKEVTIEKMWLEDLKKI
jgi:DNA topoisomerase-2